MMPLSCRDIARAVGGTLLQTVQDPCTGVTTDSRTAAAGQLFIPLRGEKFDGHAYVPAALSAGAWGVLTAETPAQMQPGKCYIRVEDTLLALRALGSWYRDKFSIPMVQITGSAGKTTTKEMVAAVLTQHFTTLRTQGNLNNHIGAPLTLLQLEPQHQAAVIETGMNHFGEIRYLGQMVRPTVALITNVGDAHIENMGGTRQGTLRAKCEIFENLQPGGLAVLNGDDPLLQGVQVPYPTVLCGLGENCQVRVSAVEERGIEGVDCTVTTPKDTYRLHIPSPGGYMIYPAAMAIAVGEHLGLTREEMIRGVAAYRPVGSRMRLIRRGEGRLIIDDCYNANPQAMAEALRILAQTKSPRRAAVLGDMGELGDLTVRAHREVGALAAELGLDAVFAIGSKARDIRAACPGASWYPDKETALPDIVKDFTPGTALLVKASHAMDFGKLVKELEKA